MAIRTDLAILRRLLLEARSSWLPIAGIFALDLLLVPLVLLSPLPLKMAVDSLTGSGGLPGFLVPLLPAGFADSGPAVVGLAAALLVTVAVLGRVQSLCNSLLRTAVGEKLVLDFRARLFGHIQRLSLAYHDTRGTADGVYRLREDAPAIQHVAIDGILPFITALVTVSGMLYVSFRIDWRLALVALAVAPLLLLLIHFYRGRLRRQWREARRLDSAAQAVLQEVLGALRVVKAYGQEDREAERFVRHSGEGMRARIRLSAAEARFGLLVGLVTALGTAAALVLGAAHVRQGVLTLGDLVLMMGYLGQLYSPLTTMSRKVARMQSHLASAERVFALLDAAPEVEDRRGARAVSRAAGAIEIRGMSFAYPVGPRVLHDVSFRVPAGTRVGICGETGAGKTTLVSLLTRFYDPTEGSILLDGVDLRDYQLADLRDQFAIVLQEPVLFSTTIAENIAYARPAASMTEIVEAARAANAHDFIMGLPDGYDSHVGERGMRVSGGERQRIGLARAFLKDAPLLILDEPTSAVDTGTEAGIIDAMDRLSRGRTTFLIAHRQSTLRSCEVLLVLADGRLAEVRSAEPAETAHA